MDWQSNAQLKNNGAFHPSRRRMRPSWTAPDGARRQPLSMGLRETAIVFRAKAVYRDSWNRTQLYIITRLCGQNLVASQRVLTELQQLSAAPV